MSEIRYDILHDTDVIIAPERLHRPDSFTKKPVRSSKENCPFCEGHEFMTPPEIFAIRDANSLANEGSWKTRVVPNLYKALQIETPYQHHDGAFEHWEGFGAHEVIIDTPKHYTSMAQWDKDTVVNWLKTLAQRVGDLRCDNRIAFLSLFKNEGTQAGATQQHSHTQLIGMPLVPKLTRHMYHRCEEYYTNKGRAILEDMIIQEEEVTSRIVRQHGDFTAFCPYASAYPFEVIISSKKALGHIDTLDDGSIEDISVLILESMKKISQQVGALDCNIEIFTPPLHETYNDHAHRFAVRIMPRIYRLGGFEVTSGVHINPLSPELAAELLRRDDV